VSADHYFSASPGSAHIEQTLTVDIQGTPMTVTSASGTFSSDGLDRGTRVLLESVPTPPQSGVLVDVGCGWGPISLALATASPHAKVIAVDVNERARELAAQNASAHQLSNIEVLAPEDFPHDVQIDCVWSNPPIRIGKQALHDLLTAWLNRLAPAGVAYLVVAKKLGSDSLQKWLNDGGAGSFTCERIGTDKGFRVLRVARA
jgi:16S rRNA (guanine1207-N2)-methyltransferase